MFRTEVEQELTTGHRIVVFASNGNRYYPASAKVLLLDKNVKRARTSREQEGILNEIETTNWMGNIGWSKKKQYELLSVLS